MTGPTDPRDPLAGDPIQTDRADAELLAELRGAVAAADPVPDRLLDTAKAAYGWRRIDEELANLQFDSLAGSEVLVRGAVVGTTGDRASDLHLSFATGEVSIEVDVADRMIFGQVVPAGATEVTLVQSTGHQLSSPCDALGQFSFDRRPTGPIRLVARQPGGDIVTAWFTV
jgi:hypothetical protein